MSQKPSVRMLPERERTEMLQQFLTVIDQHPDLAYFRTYVRTGQERQLALLAAFERAVILGTPAMCPPNPDDEADRLLCDILDIIESDPDLKRHGSYYGADRYLTGLQALGVWRGTTPLNQPTARELFTTSFSRLSTDAASDLAASEANNSPASQDVGSGGELIDPATSGPSPAADSTPSPQTIDGVLVLSIAPGQSDCSQTPHTSGIIHHASQKAGEQPADAVPVGWDKASPEAAGPPAPHLIPARPLRRGQPPKLDDMAKGRLLGLMSYGLSFRQAAAQLGVHHVTLLNLLKRDPEFAQQVSEARLDAISQPLLTVVHASRTSWRAAAWLAKFLEDRRSRTLETTPEERALENIKHR